jgi:hypothetical protein
MVSRFWLDAKEDVVYSSLGSSGPIFQERAVYREYIAPLVAFLGGEHEKTNHTKRD